MMTKNWTESLDANPVPWLLEDDNPAVKHLALLHLMDRDREDAEVKRARAAAMASDPIAAILANQQPEGYWEKPGPGYATKYRGTVWQLMFLDQMGADGDDERVRAACEYVLSHSQAEIGGFGASGDENAIAPRSSNVIHCLNGNLLRALIGFGWLDDDRTQRAIEWQARSITGEDFSHFRRSGTNGPDFACAVNEGFPCAWGAIKAMLALTRIPVDKREPHVQRAIEQGTAFLLSRDPATADYPMGSNAKPSESWFKPGFPLGYVADLLQNLEALCDLGYAKDPRLIPAIQWLLSKQDSLGRWKNQHAYNGRTWVDFDQQGQPGKWVTLRACRVLKAVYG